MRKFIHNLQQILPLVHNTHLPAFIFALALLGFYLCGDIAEQSMLTLHAAFFLLNVTSAGILIYFNVRIPRCRISFFLHPPQTGLISSGHLSELSAD